MTEQPKDKTQQSDVSLVRHSGRCTICSHQQREEIERQFVNWASPTRIAAEHNVSRDSIYRHVSATGLMEKRRKNIKSALERIIEQAGEVDVNAAAVVSAIQAYAKINAQGQWVDRAQAVNLNELFDRMTRDELARYAQDGSLPDWFPGEIAAGRERN